LSLGDDVIENALYQLSLLPVERCAEVIEQHRLEPHKRTAQRTLAQQLTELVHGSSVLSAVEHATQLL